MNKKVLILLIFIVVLAAGAGGFFLAVHTSGNELFTTTPTPYEEKSFDEKVEELSSNPSADSYDKLILLKEEYSLLTDEEKAEIKNYQLIEPSIKACSEAKRLEVVNEMTALTENSSKENQNKIENLLLKYKPILKNEDIESYLSYAIHNRVLKDSEKAIKKTLKNPESFKRKKYEIREYAFKIDKKGYEIRTDLAYTAKNSYGKTVSNQRTVYCYYKIKDGKIKLVKSGISTLDKWKIEH